MKKIKHNKGQFGYGRDPVKSGRKGGRERFRRIGATGMGILGSMKGKGAVDKPPCTA